MSEPRRRVACYVVRQVATGPELLVFDHIDFPGSGTQVPAGGVEPDESIAAAAVREVQEETDLTDVAYDGPLGVSESPHPDTGAARHTTYVLLRTSHVVHQWTHTVRSEGSDDGLRFACRFVPLPLDEVVLADDQGIFLQSIPKAPDRRL